MKLTPLEVENEEFSRRLRGYDPAEVDAFKRLVAARIDELQRESLGLAEEVARLKEELQAHKEREKGVQEALYTARQLAEEVRTQARREADILRAEAELDGEEIRRDAERQLQDIRREINELRQQRTRTVVELRSLLEGQLHLLELQTEGAGGGLTVPFQPAAPSTVSGGREDAARRQLAVEHGEEPAGRKGEGLLAETGSEGLRPAAAGPLGDGSLRAALKLPPSSPRGRDRSVTTPLPGLGSPAAQPPSISPQQEEPLPPYKPLLELVGEPGKRPAE
ncbi:MAG: DivIVA domain-containing protein [Myxococcota bacterium]|jgi:cell division initiation protein|nr:DivIVA domain-containing protein [Myxococcota bacterium]